MRIIDSRIVRFRSQDGSVGLRLRQRRSRTDHGRTRQLPTPEQYYMRGPGPERRAKHQSWQSFDSEAGPSAGHHRLSPVYVRRRDAANPPDSRLR